MTEAANSLLDRDRTIKTLKTEKRVRPVCVLLIGSLFVSDLPGCLDDHKCIRLSPPNWTIKNKGIKSLKSRSRR